MRVIIAGSRTITDYGLIRSFVNGLNLNITVVVSGKAIGVDTLGEQYAKEHMIPISPYPADWIKLGKRAGYIRNAEMAKNADALIAFHDGESRGTKHMIDIALKRGLLTYILRTDDMFETDEFGVKHFRYKTNADIFNNQ